MLEDDTASDSRLLKEPRGKRVSSERHLTSVGNKDLVKGI